MSFSRTPRAALLAAGCLLCTTVGASADTQEDRFGAAGYFRIATRPDFQGGDSKLGYSNLYGRLLNEGPYAFLELRMNLLTAEPGTNDPWTSVHARIEGGTIGNTDPNLGSLDGFRLSQLYVQAGNVLLENVTWRLGTLWTYNGDLGLYDIRPNEIFFETVGLSAQYQKDGVTLLAGFGDSGFTIRGERYNTIPTVGAAARVAVGEHVLLGAGGQFFYEPKVTGNRFAPHNTPDIDYEDFLRGEILATYLDENPGQLALFPRPMPTSSSSFKGYASLEFGRLGALRWNSLYATVRRLHPETFVTETAEGQSIDIFVESLTDERYELQLGNEMQLAIIDGKFDITWSALLGKVYNNDNEIAAGEDNRWYFSAVARGQVYLSPTFHVLAEVAGAHEVSSNGNLFRNHKDSVFQSTNGIQDPRGLEFGDSDTRDTFQGKAGVVINPLGTGIYSRPSLRLLYGMQYSTQNNAFGNSFVDRLDINQQFDSEERHLHHVLAVEAEVWF